MCTRTYTIRVKMCDRTYRHTRIFMFITTSLCVRYLDSLSYFNIQTFEYLNTPSHFLHFNQSQCEKTREKKAEKKRRKRGGKEK
jgi:hypothetical protein